MVELLLGDFTIIQDKVRLFFYILCAWFMMCILHWASWSSLVIFRTFCGVSGKTDLVLLLEVGVDGGEGKFSASSTFFLLVPIMRNGMSFFFCQL